MEKIIGRRREERRRNTSFKGKKNERILNKSKPGREEEKALASASPRWDQRQKKKPSRTELCNFVNYEKEKGKEVGKELWI